MDDISPNRIFISYASEDYATARRLYDDLKHRGFAPWLDRVDLLPGQRREFEINRVIRSCSRFIAMLSKNSLSRRGHVQKELKKALDVLAEYPQDSIFLLPVKIEECAPQDESLRQLHWIELFPSYSESLEVIIRALNAGSVENPEECDDLEKKVGGEDKENNTNNINDGRTRTAPVSGTGAMSIKMDSSQIERLTEAMEKCDAMRHPQKRDSVVEGLPQNIQSGIERKTSARDDIASIIRRCAQFSGGIDELMSAVRFRDRNTEPYENAARVWETLKMENRDGAKGPQGGEAGAIITGNGAAPASSVSTGAPDAQAGRVRDPGSTPNDPPVPKMEGAPERWEKIAAFAFGVLFLTFMILIAIFIKDPTPFQYTFFRVAMALAAAGVGAVLPGLIQLEVNHKYLPLIRAGGAIALFVLVFLFNPPPIPK